jgi:hypothetical protein
MTLSQTKEKRKKNVNIISKDFLILFFKPREEKAGKSQCWRSLFIETYSDVGRYIDHYAAIKKAWRDLKKYLEPRCPRMVLSLKGTGTQSPPSTF